MFLETSDHTDVWTENNIPKTFVYVIIVKWMLNLEQLNLAKYFLGYFYSKVIVSIKDFCKVSFLCIA